MALFRRNINTRDNSHFRDLSDREITMLYKKTLDKALIGELFNRYSHLVLGLCFKYLEKEEESKDATMQVFEKLYDALLQFEVENFNSWIYSVAKNHCLHILRKAKTFSYNDQILLKNFQDDFMENIDGISLKGASQKPDMEKLLYSSLEQLNQDQRTCIELFYFKEWSYKEITEKTQYSLNDVKSHIQNGKRNLKIMLEKTK